MRPARIWITILSLGTVLSFSGPASALHGLTGDNFVPYTPVKHVYFHCEGATKIHNVEVDGAIPWSLIRPVSNLSQGGGCGSLDNAAFGTNQTSYQDSHFEGTYGGNIDAVTVDAYFGPVGVALGSSSPGFSLNVRLAIDGVPILGLNGRDVNVQMTDGPSTGEHIKFTITGINLMDEANDTVHEVLLTLSGGAFASNAVLWDVRDMQTVWLYDATEFESGLIFNPTTIEADNVPR
jgi:hypothetical protein